MGGGGGSGKKRPNFMSKDCTDTCARPHKCMEMGWRACGFLGMCRK